MKKVIYLLMVLSMSLIARDDTLTNVCSSSGACGVLADNEQVICFPHEQNNGEHTAPCCTNEPGENKNLFEIVDILAPQDIEDYKKNVRQNAIGTEFEPYIYTKIASETNAQFVILGKTADAQICPALLANGVIDSVTLLDETTTKANKIVYRYTPTNDPSSFSNDGNLSDINGSMIFSLKLDEKIPKEVYKRLKVKINGHYGELQLEGNATDPFSIRPDRFEIVTSLTSTDDKLYAKEHGIKQLKFLAVDTANDLVIYNETDRESFYLDLIDRNSSKGCKTGSLYSSDTPSTDYLNPVAIKTSLNDKKLGYSRTKAFLFNDVNGSRDTTKNEYKMTYFGVGELDMNMTEVGLTPATLYSTIWATIDSDDNKYSGGIHKDILTVTPHTSFHMNRVYPDHINIDDKNITASSDTNGQKWLYMANNMQDVNLTISYDVNLTGYKPDVNSQVTLTNFNHNCYAEDINIDLNGSINIPNGDTYDVNMTTLVNNEVNMTGTSLYTEVVDNTSNTKIVNGILNNSTGNTFVLRSLKSGFGLAPDVNGTASFSMSFNVDRNMSVPKEAFRFEDLILDSNRSENIVNVRNLETADNNITFYYGKVYAEDLITSDHNDSSNIYALIYQNNGTIELPGELAGVEQRNIMRNWYLNQEDTNSNVNVSGLGLYKSSLFDSSISPLLGFTRNFDPALGVFDKGIIKYEITKTGTNLRGKTHFEIPKYMWTSRNTQYSFDTSGILSSNCLQHPCSTYEYLSNINQGVKSGDTSGSMYQLKTDTIKRRKLGSKSFR